MNFILSIYSAPSQSGALSGYRFAQAVLSQGHEISQIFFYQDGVLNAYTESAFSQLAQLNISLLACPTALSKRNIDINQLTNGFKTASLTQYFDSLLKSDRYVVFSPHPPFVQSLLQGKRGISPLTTEDYPPHFAAGDYPFPLAAGDYPPQFAAEDYPSPLAGEGGAKCRMRGIGILIHTADNTEDALDFILAASNITENIAVIFIKQGVNLMNQFKALKGFEINQIYAEKESLDEYNIDLNQCALTPYLLSHKAVKKYVTHCQQLFAF